MSSTSILPSDPLETILYRLDGTVLKVSQLRQSLGDLETELSEIREQCENAIRTRVPAAFSVNEPQILVSTDGGTIVHDSRIHKPGASPYHPSPVEQKRKLIKKERIGISRPTERPICKPKRDPEPRPARKTAGLSTKTKSGTPVPGDSSSRIAGASGSPSGGIRKARHLLKTAAQTHVDRGVAPLPGPSHTIQEILFQHPPRPPTDSSAFLENISLSSYPSGLKREGPDWFVLFNSSPKVKRVLDVTLVHTLLPSQPVTCVKFNQDAKWVATGILGSAQVYDVETGTRNCILYHGMTTVQSLCFSPDGKYLATGADDKQIRVWNIAEKRIHITLEGHRGDIFSVHFSANGRYIVSGAHDRTVRIWDVCNRIFKVVTIDDHYLPHGHHHGVWSIALSLDGRYVAVASENTVVSIWEVTTGVLVQRLRGHRDHVYCIAFTPDGKGLISGSANKMLKYWDVSGLGIGSDANTALTRTTSGSSSHCLINFIGHKDRVDCIAVSPDSNWVVSGSADGNILFWDTRTGVVQCVLSGHKGGIIDVDLSPLGNFLVTASSGSNPQLRIWRYHVTGIK